MSTTADEHQADARRRLDHAGPGDSSAGLGCLCALVAINVRIAELAAHLHAISATLDRIADRR
jgi:hypothetical protein